MAAKKRRRTRKTKNVSRKRILEVELPRLRKGRGRWVPLRRYKNGNAAHVARARVLKQARRFRPRVEVVLEGTVLYGRLRRA